MGAGVAVQNVTSSVSEAGKLATVKALLDAGADPAYPNGRGDTALQWARGEFAEEYPDCCKHFPTIVAELERALAAKIMPLYKACRGERER